MAVLELEQELLTSPLNGFIAVKVEMLRRLNSAGVDLFVQYEPDHVPLLYHRAGCPLEPHHLASLLDADVRQIYVRTDDFQTFGAHLLEAVETHSNQETVPQAERFAALQIALAGEIERTAHMVDCGQYVDLSVKVAQDIVSLLAANDVLPKDLFRLARHDFNTFTHVTNVASYSVVLGKRLGYAQQQELAEIATGAMLHDLGKRFIPARILSKPARLDPEERAIIETHPQRGYEELCQRSDVTINQLMMTYQHHERVDGKGYPVGIMGDEMHPWARMLAVVDVFDAMTGTRPYRRSASAHEAMEYIRQNAGTHFDEEVVRCWISTMSNG